MAVKNIKTRMQQLTDTSANWANKTNFIPKKGELVVYTDLYRFKIGDGTTKLNELLFEDIPTISITNDNLESGTGKIKFSNIQWQIIKSNIPCIQVVANLSGEQIELKGACLGNNVYSIDQEFRTLTGLVTYSENEIQNFVLKDFEEITNDPTFVAKATLERSIVGKLVDPYEINSIIGLNEIKLYSSTGKLYTEAIGQNYVADNSIKGEIFNDYNDNKASGNYSHAEGKNTLASGEASHASGEGTIANQAFMTAIGMYNIEGDEGDLFVIGNGTSTTRSNAFKINSDAILTLGGTEVNEDQLFDSIVNIEDTTIELENDLYINTSHYFTSGSSVAPVAGVTFNLPDEDAYTGAYSNVIFYTGSGLYTGNITLSETVLGTIPTLLPNKRYELSFMYDGRNWSILSSVLDVPTT